jgi:hypothetical protein
MTAGPQVGPQQLRLQEVLQAVLPGLLQVQLLGRPQLRPLVQMDEQPLQQVQVHGKVLRQGDVLVLALP